MDRLTASDGVRQIHYRWNKSCQPWVFAALTSAAVCQEASQRANRWYFRRGARPGQRLLSLILPVMDTTASTQFTDHRKQIEPSCVSHRRMLVAANPDAGCPIVVCGDVVITCTSWLSPGAMRWLPHVGAPSAHRSRFTAWLRPARCGFYRGSGGHEAQRGSAKIARLGRPCVVHHKTEPRRGADPVPLEATPHRPVRPRVG